MSMTRRAVLEQLAAVSDAARRETTTIGALAGALDADERTVRSHIEGLEVCDLARIAPDGTVRVTITGEELLELDTEAVVIVDADSSNSGT
jgi:DNA-binding transcriptional ArsR family regulator